MDQNPGQTVPIPSASSPQALPVPPVVASLNSAVPSIAGVPGEVVPEQSASPTGSLPAAQTSEISANQQAGAVSVTPGLPESPVLPSVPGAPVTPATVTAATVGAGSPAPTRSVLGRAIDLLPELSNEQVQKIQKKGKTNVFGVLLVFSVIAVTASILIINLLTQMDYNKKKQDLADAKNEIMSLQFVEVKQRALVTKVSAYQQVRDFDFSPDIVLTYLLDVAGGLSEVTAMELNEQLEFSVTGTTDSYINVARLWHDMATQKEYFESISLDSVSKNDDEEGNSTVSFSFSGKMIRENIDKL